MRKHVQVRRPEDRGQPALFHEDPPRPVTGRGTADRAARRGAAVVELALIVPILATLLVGICELGQSLRVEAILAEASRNGCAAASRPGGGNADATREVRNVLTAAALPANDATITILVNNQAGNAASARRNDKISVTVAIPSAKVRFTRTNFFMAQNSVQTVTTSMLKAG